MDAWSMKRLRRAMLRAGHDTETLAEAAGVAGKSVQRLDRRRT